MIYRLAQGRAGGGNGIQVDAGKGGGVMIYRLAQGREGG